jgi:hypothetical protein
MAHNYGTTGVAYIKLQSAVGTSGKPIRVFDIAIADTAGIGTCALYNGTSTAGTCYVSIFSANTYFNSNAGIRFPEGCFALASGTSAIVNYIEEF